MFVFLFINLNCVRGGRSGDAAFNRSGVHFFFSFVFALHTVTIKRVNICRKKALFIVFVLVLRCKQILFARTGSEGFR